MLQIKKDSGSYYAAVVALNGVEVFVTKRFADKRGAKRAAESLLNIVKTVGLDMVDKTAG